jgi:MFS family permease
MSEPVAQAEPAAQRQELGLDAAASPPGRGRAEARAVIAILGYQGYAYTILGVGAPFIAKSFGLSQSAMARTYAWIALHALGALILSRMADRYGRRRVILLGLAVTPLASLGVALSHGIAGFIFFETITYAAIGATFSSCFVMLAEALPIAERAKGQGYAQLAISWGGGVCVILTPVLAHFGWSWRWLLAIPVAGIALAPTIGRMIPESRRWQRAIGAGAADKSRFYDVFRPPYRRRAIPLVAAALLGDIAGAAVHTWAFYHAVTVVGLSPAKASVMMLTGGSFGVAGLALGAWTSERIGRVRSVATLGIAGIAGSLAFYWGPPANFAWPMIWLTVAHSCHVIAGRGTLVAATSAVTELFPTQLRSTILGWLALCGAISAITAQVTIAIFAGPLGGLSNVVGWLTLLMSPCATVWVFFIQETRGLSLETAAGEEPFAAASPAALAERP